MALWNDQPYDNQAIFSGSATVVNGTVVLVYPGLCDTQNADGGENKQCLSGRNLATAVPADPTDPLLKQWRKRGIIVANSNGNQSHPYAKPDDGKDPSTAWQTAFGEWRFVTGGTPIMYGSMDFDDWYLLGLGFTTKMQSCSPCLSNGYPCTNSDCFVGAGGDCPSLFPLPGRTPGAGPSPDNKTEPTHVHMSFGGSMSLGWMEDGAPRSVGNWTDAGEKSTEPINFRPIQGYEDQARPMYHIVENHYAASEQARSASRTESQTMATTVRPELLISSCRSSFH